jgi:hypothetical protein
VIFTAPQSAVIFFGFTHQTKTVTEAADLLFESVLNETSSSYDLMTEL